MKISITLLSTNSLWSPIAQHGAVVFKLDINPNNIDVTKNKYKPIITKMEIKNTLLYI